MSLWCNLVIVAQISLEMVVTKKKNDASLYRIKGNEIWKEKKKMELDILKIFVLTVHPCTVFIHVLLLGVNISHIHVSLLVCFQFPI